LRILVVELRRLGEFGQCGRDPVRCGGPCCAFDPRRMTRNESTIRVTIPRSSLRSGRDSALSKAIRRPLVAP
jgi:hypothetical protein